MPAGKRALSDAHRAVALQNLGIAELWSLRLDDARQHLEQALSLSRRTGRPWLEIAPLAHLAIANVLSGRPVLGGLRQSEEAVRFADTHGWSDDPVIVTALATSARRCSGSDGSPRPRCGWNGRSRSCSLTASRAPN